MVFKKGYKPTEEQKRKQSETRQKLISEGKIDMKKQMSNPEIREKISKKLKGKKHSKQRRENISKAVKKSYENGRKISSPIKVTQGKIKYEMRKGIQKPITHWIWFDKFGYFPKKDEVIHHINFNESNNEFENLKLMKRSDHTMFHNDRKIKEKSNPR